MTVQHMPHLHRSIRFLLTATILVIVPLRLCAVTVSPGLAMIQNIPPGQEVTLGTFNLFIYGHNDGDEDQTFSFEPQQPNGTWGRDWEAGYEPFPDLSWCHMVETLVDCKPKEKAAGNLVLNIPDRPENYNRKWVLCVLVKKQNRQRAIIGAGLAVAVRLMIETTVKDDVDGVAAGPLAFVPGTITLEGKPGQKVEFEVKLRNNSGARMTCQAERLNQIYSKPHKYARYTTTGYEALMADSWLTPVTPLFTLESEAKVDFKLAATIPETVDASKKYEELVFIRGTGPINGDDGNEGMAAMTFVRVRFHIVTDDPNPIPAPEPAPPK
jgi:hypothetical protein